MSASLIQYEKGRRKSVKSEGVGLNAGVEKFGLERVLRDCAAPQNGLDPSEQDRLGPSRFQYAQPLK
jgi:hypothetical protein